MPDNIWILFIFSKGPQRWYLDLLEGHLDYLTTKPSIQISFSFFFFFWWLVIACLLRIYKQPDTHNGCCLGLVYLPGSSSSFRLCAKLVLFEIKEFWVPPQTWHWSLHHLDSPPSMNQYYQPQPQDHYFWTAQCSFATIAEAAAQEMR